MRAASHGGGTHLQFNCRGQSKERGRKTKWQNWTVHLSGGWRDLVAAWIVAHSPCWAPDAVRRLILLTRDRTEGAKRNSTAVCHSHQLRSLIKGKAPMCYRSGHKFFLHLFTWSSCCEWHLVLSFSSKVCICATGTHGYWIYQVPVKGK